jgi:DNA-binding CsgD family transcriptional regulator
MAGDEEFALSIYQVLRARGGAAPDAAGRALGLADGQIRRAVRRLGELGLVKEHPDGLLEPLDPDAALLRTLDACRANAAEQAHLEQLTRSLTTVYRPAVARETSQVAVEYYSDKRRRDRIVSTLDTTTRESTDAMHPGPLPPLEVLEESRRRDAAAVRRGVRLRAIYPQAVAQTAKYARHLQDLAGIGVEVRLVDHAPYDLVVFDRLVVCLPADPAEPGKSMVVVRGSALVNIHLATFDDYWLRAVPYGDRPPSRPGAPTDLSPQERVVIRLMADGLSDDRIARKLGIHRRTVQRAVAGLMERLNASSRFEAGLKLAQSGEFARAIRPPGPGPGAGPAAGPASARGGTGGGGQ